MFGHGGAAFHPVAGVDVAHALNVLDQRVVDMAADDAVGAGTAGILGHRLMEGADEADGVLDLSLAQAEKDQ